MTASLARALAPSLVTSLPTDVPVEPGRQEARAWAVQELAGREYQAARPGLVERVLAWLLDQLSSLPLPQSQGSALGVAVAALVIGVLVAVALWRARGLAARRRASSAGSLLAATTLTAAQHRAAAERHAAEQHWSAAVVERFRAVARELEERAVLVPQPGRTADEVARDAARWLPAEADTLAGGARLFDDVAYGERPTGPEDYERLVVLDAAVRRARPVMAS